MSTLTLITGFDEKVDGSQAGRHSPKQSPVVVLTVEPCEAGWILRGQTFPRDPPDLWDTYLWLFVSVVV